MKESLKSEMTLARMSDIFAALSNPSRLQIVRLLCLGELTVGEVATAMKIGPSGASQHLAILARAGVLVSEPRGTSRIYKIRGPRIVAILGLIEEFCHVHGLYGAPSKEEGEDG